MSDKRKCFAVGTDNFARIRENGNYYIDKTAFISDLLSADFMVSLITRPRRFGKTLTMSMLEDFFDITRDSRRHFDGLKITENRSVCEKWMNQWPVIFVSLKTVEGLDFEGAFGSFEVLVANLCKKYAFLGESASVDEEDRKLFQQFKAQKADKKNLKDVFLVFTRMMSSHFGKPCILLIDEYDVPLARANENGYYREMLDVIRGMFNASLKSNDYLRFAVITGCLKIAKESVFTGLNNVVSNTVSTERFDEYIGFTHEDVERILRDTGLTDHAAEIRQWYDGYRFGSVNVYCPWDVMNHIADLYENPKAVPANHWASTSHNHVIYRLLQNPSFNVNEKMETLLAGGTIREVITEDLTYDTLDASEENLWSLLLMTGYLTRQAEEEDTEGACFERNGFNENVVALRIPNEEVRLIFRKAIVDWMKQNMQTYDRTELFRSLWNGDAKTAESIISELLFSSISYHDYKESYYHAFVAGLFIGAGYAVESNYERGDGRPDIVIHDRRRRRAILIEVKHAKKGETLEHACREAAEQIEDKRYAQALDGYQTVLCYGIGFKGKDCMISIKI